LIHSSPRWTATINKYEFPENAKVYGQSFICITLKSLSSLQLVAEALSYKNPHMHDKDIPQKFFSSHKVIKELIDRTNIKIRVKYY
jgi:hypothetical protein